jgi:hypothetical protein
MVNFESKIYLLVGSLAFAAALSSCSTVQMAAQRGGDKIDTNTITPVASAKADRGAGGVLVVTEFQGLEESGIDESTACRWRVINTETNASAFIPVKPNEPNSFVHLEPGTYKTARLGCGIGHVWDLEGVFKNGFEVQAGHVSYLGKVFFIFKGRDLDSVKTASRTQSAEALASAQAIIPAEGMDVISGFTGGAINRDVAGENHDGFQVVGKGIDTSALQPLLMNLKACANSKKDPMKIGGLQYVAVYREGRFSEMLDRKEDQSLSDDLRACVERDMMSFHPAEKTEVQVNVKY